MTDDFQKMRLLEDAIERHINNHKIEIYELIPVYEYTSWNRTNAVYSIGTNQAGSLNNSWGTNDFTRQGIVGYAYATSTKNSVPVYEYTSWNRTNAVYSTGTNQAGSLNNSWGTKDFTRQGIAFYAIKNTSTSIKNSVPVYEYTSWNRTNAVYSTGTNQAGSLNNSWGTNDFTRQGIAFYLFQ